MALNEIQAKFGGKWEIIRSENVENYMKERGFSDVTAKSAATEGGEEKIEVKDGKIWIALKRDGYLRDNLFKLDEPFYFETNQVKHKAIAFYKAGKLEMNVHLIDSDSPPYRIVREIIDGELVATMYARDVVAKRIFKHL